MRITNFFSVAAAVTLLLGLHLSAARADSDPPAVHVNIFETCHKGLVVWLPDLPLNPKCGQVQTPQVKVFDSAGHLRFIGSALKALEWAKSGQPSAPVPQFVVVRDAASEARITHVSPPPTGHGWVTYYKSTSCPPCDTQLAQFRAEVLPKLGAGTALSIFEIGE